MIRSVSALDADRLANGGDELAFFDVRELGPYSEGHPLFANSLPYSTLEARVVRLAPRRSVRVVLIDGGDGLSFAAAELLRQIGYSDVSVVEGGTPAWLQSGLELLEGVHVPSKTLGEIAHQRWGPELVAPERLAKWVAEGRDFEFLDCRPSQEYSKATVPGASSLPVGEILCRIQNLRRDTPVVLTCAGRTRGIIAACTLGLIDSGRKYFALENGTQGWVLSGRRLVRDLTPRNPTPLTPHDREVARERAAEFMERFEIPQIDPATARQFREDACRTTYFFDTRLPEDASSDCIPAFVNAPAGQLVQQTDAFAGVLRARFVLADDLGLRSAFAAFWLRALGHDAFVSDIGDEVGSIRPVEIVEPPWPNCEEIQASVALAQVRKGVATVLDCRTSREYSESRIAGSVWSSRPLASRLNRERRWLVADCGGTRAALMCKELGRIGLRDYAKVAGGVPALVEAGAEVASGEFTPVDDAVDFATFADGRHEGNLDASRAYLDWELGLPSCLTASERSNFAI